MLKKSILPLVFLALLPLFTSPREKKGALRAGGYLSSVQSLLFDEFTGPFTNDQLLHNRLNLSGNLGSRLSFAAEFRNRLFTGDRVQMGNHYAGQVNDDPGWADLSWNLLSENSFFLNTTIDRLWLEFSAGRFEARAGRQRINWGQTLVWNPNDLFNAYSFFDFDYIERPGSDAVTVRFYPSASSFLELAAKIDSREKPTIAGLWRFNRWSYDIQFLAGYTGNRDWVAGAGWSGAIASLSFRGETTLFIPANPPDGEPVTFLATAGFDKILKDNSMAQIQIMYCNNPLDLTHLTRLYTGNLTAKELAFSEFTAFGQFSWAATPLLNLSVSAMWFPGPEGYYAGPALDWSLAQNVDLSLVWQHFDSLTGTTRTRMNLGFLRFKYSF